jgi:hypothetical protein
VCGPVSNIVSWVDAEGTKVYYELRRSMSSSGAICFSAIRSGLGVQNTISRWQLNETRWDSVTTCILQLAMLRNVSSA